MTKGIKVLPHSTLYSLGGGRFSLGLEMVLRAVTCLEAMLREVRPEGKKNLICAENSQGAGR